MVWLVLFCSLALLWALYFALWLRALVLLQAACGSVRLPLLRAVFAPHAVVRAVAAAIAALPRELEPLPRAPDAGEQQARQVACEPVARLAPQVLQAPQARLPPSEPSAEPAASFAEWRAAL